MNSKGHSELEKLSTVLVYNNEHYPNRTSVTLTRTNEGRSKTEG